MSFYYPQAVMVLKVKWEDFGATISEELSRFVVVAKRVRVSINDYTKADEFDAEIDYKNFPFDPRAIRAVQVTIHIEDKKKVFLQNNQLNRIVPSEENTVFTGFVDEESITLDEQDRVVRFEGRDQTSLLIDATYSGKALDLTKSVDQVIQSLVDELPATKGKLTVENRAGSLPSLASVAPDYEELSRTRSSKKKEKYWDVIQDVAQRAALIAYVELDTLVITKPRVLYGDSQPIRFIYGNNLENLTFKRKIGRQRGVNIKVQSFNPEKKEVLTAKIPEESTNEWANALGVAQAPVTIDKLDKNGEPVDPPEEAPYFTFNVPDIASKDQLIEIGQSLYEEIGRQQIEGTFTTKEMCILDVINNVERRSDLVKVRNGTPVAISVEGTDLEKIQRDVPKGDRKAYLERKCFKPEVAAAFAEVIGKFANRFYTREVTFTVDQTQGFQMELGFVNFIETTNKSLGG